jgi:hypothetical protein
MNSPLTGATAWFAQMVEIVKGDVNRKNWFEKHIFSTGYMWPNTLEATNRI